MDEEESPRPRVQSLPSDYSDVQPESYDPEFISHISSKMQVPYNLVGVEGVRADNMKVPDRIMVAGEGKHLGGRQGFQQLDFDKATPYVNYVGLQTPPRTLTMEEALNFPLLEDRQEEEREQNMSQNHPRTYVPNGELSSRQPQPFIPGDSINESLLMNDLDENTQLRNAVAKLTRRVKDLEDNDKTRSYILYPTVMVLSLKLLYDVFIKSK
ncbi:mitochondrial fission factor homolog A-like [Saccostrea cucullata]|uniref:mitochondrial fission factor homolog A-like n=1 Tax=Saccostrea cuccullata TaxID=36930 RepID=UPI002ED6B188